MEDWMVLWPTIYTMETVLKYTGDDNVARSIVLMPDLLKASSADVAPDLESMLPEGRGERRARVYKMWQDGAWGPPDSPEALRKLHELSNFPHMGRTAKPGGVHWTTAEQENGELLQGGTPPTYEWYDDAIHMVVLEEFMSTPDWRRLPDNVKFAFVLHRMAHQENLARKMAQEFMEEQGKQALMAASTNGTGGEGKPPAKAPGGGPPQPPKGMAETPTAAGAK
jgi:hypothetical protein